MNSSSGVVASLDGCVVQEPDAERVAATRDRLVTPDTGWPTRTYGCCSTSAASI
ncbi:hypothetical protein [Nonomuraea sp. NPDC049028]|uniref:hypothetical protein n=1 Tax=Nonomuraea sp. NPDC049028 TaxID=3364348 RepID=UPI003713CA2A